MLGAPQRIDLSNSSIPQKLQGVLQTEEDLEKNLSIERIMG